MTEKQLKSGLRVSHRWVGVVAALILMVAGVTGFLLQHPTWLGPPSNPTLSVAADPLVAGRLLRGTHWGVELSEDGGRTWRELPMPAPPTDVVRIVFGRGNPLVVHALGSDLLVGSEDGGRIWRDLRVTAPGLGPETTFLDLTVGTDDHLHLLTDEGLLASLDGGRSWSWSNSGDGPGARNWRRFVHDLHTGHLAGVVGRRIAEAGTVALLFVTVTGLILFRRNGRSGRG